MKKKVIRFFGIMVLFVLVLAGISFVRFGGLTGFVVFGDSSQGDFDNGVYLNTEYNGSSVVLSGSSLSGNFTSRVFDVGSAALWNNVSWEEVLPSFSESVVLNPTYAEDEWGGDLTSKVEELDGDDTWERVEVQAWNDSIPDSVVVDSVVGYCDVEWSDNHADIGFQVSRNNGTTWDSEVCVQDASDGTQFGCDLKANSGVDEPSEINSLLMRCTFPTAGQNRYYSTDWVHVRVNYTSSSNLRFQARSDDDNSGWSSFAGPDGTIETYYTESGLENLNVSNNRYFQYLAYFQREGLSVNPSLIMVDLDYSVLNSAPLVSIFYPSDGLVLEDNKSIGLNFTVSDDNLNNCWYNVDDGNNLSLTDCANSSFSLANGSYILNLYANDTLGLETSDSVGFNVSVNVSLETNSSGNESNESSDEGLEDSGSSDSGGSSGSSGGGGNRGSDYVIVYEDEIVEEDAEESQENGFEFLLLDYEKAINNLRIFYTLVDAGSDARDVIVNYEIADMGGNQLVVGSEEVVLNKKEGSDYVLEIEMPRRAFGEFKLNLLVSDGIVSEEFREKIFVPFRSVSGLAVGEEDNRSLIIFGIIAVSLLIVSLVVRFLYRHHKRVSKHSFGKRKFIDIDFLHH